MDLSLNSAIKRSNHYPLKDIIMDFAAREKILANSDEEDDSDAEEFNASSSANTSASATSNSSKTNTSKTVGKYRELVRLRKIICCKCQTLMYKPVTFCCGHTICKSCCEKHMFCLWCKKTVNSIPCVNIVLQNFILNIFPEEYKMLEHLYDAFTSYNTGSYDQVLKNILKSIDVFRHDSAIYYLRSKVYGKKNMHIKALRDANVACLVDPKISKNFYRKGICEMNICKFDKAIDSFQRAIEINPFEPRIIEKIVAKIKIIQEDKESSSRNDVSSEECLANPEENNNPMNKLQYYDSLDKPIKPNSTDFECKICYEVLFRPVTIPCGHTLCKSCFAYTLDHKLICPICRYLLDDYVIPLQCSDVVITDLITLYFPNDWNTKCRLNKDIIKKFSRIGEEHVGEFDVPLLVREVLFPSLPYHLYIYEPKYRLMMRNCISANTLKFGICAPGENGETYASTGTIAEVESYKVINDGRYIVKVRGAQRIEILSTYEESMLTFGKARILHDQEETLNPNQILGVYNALCGYCHDTIIDPQLIQSLGPIPPFVADEINSANIKWLWYGFAILPINRSAKSIILRSNSKLEKIMVLQRFINLISQSNTPN